MPDSLVENLPLAESGEAVWNACAEFFQGYGFDRLIYVDRPPAGMRMHTTFPQSWLEHYRLSGYEKIDPFFAYCCRSLRPMGTGADYLADYPYLNMAERRLILEAGEAGMRAGMACTTRKAGPKGVGGWNIGSSLPRREVEIVFREHGDMLRLAAWYGHERLQAFPFAAADRGGLSPREAECLQWVARGLRTKQIAEKMRLRPVTVELYLRNARTKLDAATREQAVASAVMNGLITL